MLGALREGAREFGVTNVLALEGSWPEAAGIVGTGEVALMAHVGYDIEAIDPFLDAMEAAARRLCVAVLMERAPASAAEPFWEAVHGEQRLRLPGLADFLRLLLDRGRLFEVVLTAPESVAGRRGTPCWRSRAASSGWSRTVQGPAIPVPREPDARAAGWLDPRRPPEPDRRRELGTAARVTRSLPGYAAAWAAARPRWRPMTPERGGAGPRA